ncbi:MAG: DUF6600 domain-containing protein [Candidatus Hydrogenedentales bacterium]|jgi:hypothetical protein
MRVRDTIYLAGVAALLLLWGMQAAQAESTMHARISYESGGAMVQGTADADWSYATTNTLILPGDQLWADKGGTIELEMSGGSFLRMADGSKAEIIDLPPSASIRGWAGTFYIQRIARSTGDFLFITPACRIEIGQDSQVRVDVLEQGSTTVTVRWGSAVLRTDLGEAMTVTSGKRVFVDPGYLPSSTVAFDRNAEDDFDAWNRERAETLARGYEQLPSKVIETPVVGASSLSSYGEWVYVDSSYYWRPTVVASYVPYRYGYWSYVPVHGYCWVDDYPFAYVTSHYGRWHHHDRYGWLWSYRAGWGPAWVASVRYGNNFVWCPLSPYDRPVVFGDLHYTLGGSRFSLYASSYCTADRLLYGPSFVGACYPGIIRPGHGGDVHIWNINVNTGSSNASRWYRGGANIPVRDYSPRRVIRGPDTIGPRSVAASTRSAELQRSIPRASFNSVDRTGGRMIRTPMTASSREARLRSVDVDRSANPTTSAAINSASGNRVEPTGPSAERVTRSNRAASRAGAASTEPSPETSRSIRDPRNAPGVNLDRTVPSTSSGVPATPRTRVMGPNAEPTARSSSLPERTAVPGTERAPRDPGEAPRARTIDNSYGRARTPQSTSSPGRSISRGTEAMTPIPRSNAADTPGTRSRSTTAPVTSPPSQQSRPADVQRTPPRSAAPTRSVTIGGPSSTPSAGARSVRSTPAPSAAPRSAPSAPPAPSTLRSAPSVSRPAPSPMRSAPSVSRPAPSPMRSAPSVSRPAPSPMRSAPSVSRPAPSPMRSAPSVSRPAPSPMRSAPSGGASRSFSPRGR